jgi:hypothetical protein
MTPEQETVAARGNIAGDPKEWTREELMSVINELRTAAGAVYSEASGAPGIWMRLGRLVEDMREPMRRAYCAANDREYLPPPQ